MMETHHPGYIRSFDKTRIFYDSNIRPQDSSEDDYLIVFNYGLVCSNGHWSKQVPFFDKKGFNVLIHNYRGHFNSEGDEEITEVTFENMVKDLKEIVSLFKFKKLIMLGHSMGVNVTLEYAKTYPEDIAAQILISGSVFPPQDVMFNSNIMDIIFPYLEMIEETLPDLYQKIWKTGGLNPIARKLILRGGFNPKQVPESFIAEYMNRIGQLSPKLFYQLLDEMKRHSVIAHLSDIKTPTLVMGGDHDKVIPNYIQRIIHEHLENSQLYIIKDGSHVPQMDFPDTVNDRILHFIEKVTADL